MTWHSKFPRCQFNILFHYSCKKFKKNKRKQLGCLQFVPVLSPLLLNTHSSSPSFSASLMILINPPGWCKRKRKKVAIFYFINGKPSVPLLPQNLRWVVFSPSNKGNQIGYLITSSHQGNGSHPRASKPQASAMVKSKLSPPRTKRSQKSATSLTILTISCVSPSSHVDFSIQSTIHSHFSSILLSLEFDLLDHINDRPILGSLVLCFFHVRNFVPIQLIRNELVKHSNTKLRGA